MKKPGLAALWGRAFRSSLAVRSAYRLDLVLSLAVTVFSELIGPLVVLLIYGGTGGRGFPGWGLWEVLLLQSIFLLSRGVAFPLFLGLIWGVLDQVRSGTFELTLLSPRSPILILVLRGLDPLDFVRLVAGVSLFSLALSHLPSPTAASILAFAILFLISLLLLFSITLILSGTLFVWVGNGRLYELLDIVLSFAQYPLSIFPHAFAAVLSFAVPVAMVASFPAEALLGRLDSAAWISAGVSLLFFVISRLFWERMQQRYTGGGG